MGSVRPSPGALALASARSDGSDKAQRLVTVGGVEPPPTLAEGGVEAPIVDVVLEVTVLEIGHGSKSFNGKYVLVWKKTEAGWQILMDSNV